MPPSHPTPFTKSEKKALIVILTNLDCMIRHQEVLLPPHEDVVGPHQLLVVETVRVETLGILVECKKLALQNIHDRN